MLTNGTITRIDLPGGINSSNERIWTSGAARSDRCSVQSPRKSEKATLGALVAEATAVMYVRLDPSVIVKGSRVTFNLDGRASQMMEVIYVDDEVKPSLDHLEIYLKAQ